MLYVFTTYIGTHVGMASLVGGSLPAGSQFHVPERDGGVRPRKQAHTPLQVVSRYKIWDCKRG